MAFRSAAYAVVARIFKLIDSNGFTRVLFGPKIFTVHDPLDGYAFEYNDPAWSSGEETGIAFGDDPLSFTTNETRLYADDGLFHALTRAANTYNPGTDHGSNASLIAGRIPGPLFANIIARVEHDDTNPVQRVASASIRARGNAIDTRVECLAVTSPDAGGVSITTPGTLSVNSNDLWGVVRTAAQIGPLAAVAYGVAPTVVTTINLGVVPYPTVVAVSWRMNAVVAGNKIDGYTFLNGADGRRARWPIVGTTETAMGPTTWYVCPANTARVITFELASTVGVATVTTGGGLDMNMLECLEQRTGP